MYGNFKDAAIHVNNTNGFLEDFEAAMYTLHG